MYYFNNIINFIILSCMLQDGWSRSALWLYTSSTTGNPFSMSCPSKVSWETPSATLEQFHTTCATSRSFRALQATAGREPAMDAGCGLSTPGHWHGPGICNERAGVSARDHVPLPCERAALSPCSGYTPVRTVRSVRIPFGSSSCVAAREKTSQLGSEASR